MSADELEAIKAWFWRSCFSERYSGQTLRAARIDIAEMVNLREGNPHSLGKFRLSLAIEFFLLTSFRMNSARTATFVNLLASNTPRSFLSGNIVDLRSVLQAYNKSEFHHIFPKAYLEELGAQSAEVNCLANFCFLSKADNNKIRKSAPSEYVKGMPADEELFEKIAGSAFMERPDFSLEFEEFRLARAERLLTHARILTKLSDSDQTVDGTKTANVLEAGSEAGPSPDSES
jgi:hypothetical protein